MLVKWTSKRYPTKTVYGSIKEKMSSVCGRPLAIQIRYSHQVTVGDNYSFILPSEYIENG